jgi:hypothetical protein
LLCPETEERMARIVVPVSLCGVCGLLALSAVVTLSGCGGGSSPTVTPTPTPIPTPRPPVVVLGDSWTAMPANSAGAEGFDIASTGTIDATINYTYDDTVLAVWIAKGSCEFEQWLADACQYVATSMAGSRPRRVSATGQSAGTYTLIIWNVGPREEALSFQVVFTAAASASGQPGASQRHRGGDQAWGPVSVPPGRQPRQLQ